MAGTQPRRQPMGRLASSVLRRAPVGSGTPGVSAVRRRDGNQAQTVPGLQFLYGNGNRLNMTFDPGSVAPGDFSLITSPSGLQFNCPPFAVDDGFGGATITRAGLYLWATTMDLTGTAGDVVLMDDSFSQVMTGSQITVGHALGLTLPFAVGQSIPFPYIRNVAANSVDVSGVQMNVYPIL